jgi:cystathionine beta-lyase/cystathionine gamma-synthase
MSYGSNTRAIHAGQPNDAETGAVTFPIYQTSTFGQEEPGVPGSFCYSRTDNPTRRALERNLAAVEEANHGLAYASGLAAINGVLNLLKAGDRVVAGRDLYGGSYRIFTKLYAKFGVGFDFVDPTDLEAVARAFRPETKLLWLETPSNPLLTITDIRACAALAKARGVRTVVDNTFATPILQQPLKLGADLVVHSTTKYLNGHSDVIGGAVLADSKELYDELKFFQNAVGAVPGPQDCFLVLRGIKTLGLRVERHVANAGEIARRLAGDPRIVRVHYPGLASHPGHELARRQMRGFGAIVSFELAGGIAAAKRFSRATELWTLAESLGGVKSLYCHPPTMTHASVEPDVRKAAGISDGLIRLSVGLEDVEDLLADLDQALDKAARAAAVTA